MVHTAIDIYWKRAEQISGCFKNLLRFRAQKYTHSQCSVSDHTMKPGSQNCAREKPHH